MSDSEEDIENKQVKIVFLGDASVGKTSIVKRFCNDEFSRQYSPTVGADFYMKRRTLPGQREIVLKISDVGGQELTGNMLDKYLFGADIVVLVYDITSLSSFEGLAGWLARVKTDSAAAAIIGNKCDMEHQRAVRLDKTRQFADDHGIPSHCVSARTGEAVASVVLGLVARRLGLVLSRADHERQHRIVRAELADESLTTHHPPATAAATSSGLCTLQ